MHRVILAWPPLLYCNITSGPEFLYPSSKRLGNAALQFFSSSQSSYLSCIYIYTSAVLRLNPKGPCAHETDSLLQPQLFAVLASDSKFFCKEAHLVLLQEATSQHSLCYDLLAWSITCVPYPFKRQAPPSPNPSPSAEGS